MPRVQANAFVDWFDENSTEMVSGLINIAIIAVLALVLRAIVGRVIDQLA